MTGRSASDHAATGGAATPSVAAPGPSHLLLGRITLLAFLHGLLWMALVPPWQTPDEPKHFEYVRLQAAGSEIPAFASDNTAVDPALQRAILESMDDAGFWWFGRAPGYDPAGEDVIAPTAFADVWLAGGHTAVYRSSPLYYRMVALAQPSDLMLGLYVARLWSVLLAAGIVFVTGLAARELFPDDPFVRYGAPAFVALLPMFAFVHAGVNSDALVNALAAIAFLLMARLLTRGGSVARLLLMTLTVVAAVAVKRIGLVLVPSAFLAVLLWRATRARHPGRAMAAWLLAGGALVIAAVVWLLGGGWAALPETVRWNLTQYVFNEPDQLVRISAYLRAPGAPRVVVDYAWQVHNSFWGSFGWQVIALPSVVYVALGVFGLVALVGAARRVADRETPLPSRAALLAYGGAIVVAAAAAIAFFVAYLDQPFPVPPQGRYLFVAMLPIAILATAGLGAWIPRRRRVGALLALVLALLALDVTVLLGFVVPFFYG